MDALRLQGFYVAKITDDLFGTGPGGSITPAFQFLCSPF